jgi:hypothetical protein
MCSTDAEHERERALVGAGKVDFVVCVEKTLHSGQPYALDARPLINDAAIAPLTQEEERLVKHLHADQLACLVLQSGYPEEQDVLVERAKLAVQPGVRVVPSKTLGIQFPARAAALFDAVVAAPGYSTYWELSAMDQGTLEIGRKMRWHTLERPVENFAARFDHHFDNPRFNLPPIGVCIAGIALNKENFNGNRTTLRSLGLID